MSCHPSRLLSTWQLTDQEHWQTSLASQYIVRPGHPGYSTTTMVWAAWTGLRTVPVLDSQHQPSSVLPCLLDLASQNRWTVLATWADQTILVSPKQCAVLQRIQKTWPIKANNAICSFLRSVCCEDCQKAVQDNLT